MTVLNQVPYNANLGNGITKVFPYQFMITDQSHLAVMKNGVRLTLGVDYTVSGVGNNYGGNTTFPVAPASGDLIEQTRLMPFERGIDYQNMGDLLAGTLDRDQDDPVLMIQQLAMTLSQAMGRTPGSTPSSFTWNALGARLINLAAAINGTDAVNLQQAQDIAAAAAAGIPGGVGSFIQAGAGAGTRSFQDKMRDAVTPEDFKAKGDGVTDDTVAVQAALNSGRAVVAIVRDYVCDQLTSNTPGQVILGQGGRLISKSGVMSNGAQLTLNADGCQVIGLRMTDPYQQGATLASATGNRNYGIQIQSNNNRITGCHVDSYQNGIAVRAGSGANEWIGNSVTGNLVTNVLGVGVWGDAYGEDRGDGIVSWGCLTTVTGNIVIAAPGTDARIGIHCESLPGSNTSTYPYKDKMGAIAGNVVIGHFRRGIVAEGVNQVAISGNAIAGVSWWAIAAIETAGVSISGNAILYDRDPSDNAGANWSPQRAPIMVYATTACSNVLVANNDIAISGAAAACLVTQGPVTEVSFHKNKARLQGSGTVTNGIILSGTSLDVTENDMAGPSAACVFLNAGAQPRRISRNLLTGASGINGATDNLEVVGNSFVMASGLAFDTQGGTKNVKFTGNRVLMQAGNTAVSAVRSSFPIECSRNNFTLAAGQTQACMRYSSAAISGGAFLDNTIYADSASTHYGVNFDAQTNNCFNLSGTTVYGNGANFALLTFSANATRLIFRNNQLTAIAGYLINRTAGTETGPWFVDGNTNGQISLSRDPNAVGNLSASGYNAAGTKVHFLLPAAGGTEGQVCVVAGTPGTFKTFGSIAP